MNKDFSERLALWHKFVETQNAEILNELLADDVKFHSPFLWKPKDGREATTIILRTVTTVFEDFSYVRQILGEKDWALEFEARIGDLSLRGVDLIKLDDGGRIIDFEVMIRPANALQAVGLEMGKRLQRAN
ncbi:MAG: nuclear transport factor 2 family protein [Pyrinomonadaceae bacterium]